MYYWFLAFRIPTLITSIAPVLVAFLFILNLGYELDLWLAFCTLFSAVSIQIATNLFNDALDYQRGADSIRRLGKVRMVASGKLSSSQVIKGALIFLAIACFFAIPLLKATSWKLLWIGIPALYLSYGYTGGRFALAYRGVSEIFVLLFFGIFAIGGTVWIQTSSWLKETIILGFHFGLMALILLFINNLRDFQEDSISGKRTLVVRLGEKKSRYLFTFLFFLIYLFGIEVQSIGFSHYFSLSFFILPLSLFILRGIWVFSPSEKYNQYLFLSILQMLAFLCLFSFCAL